MFVLCCLSTYGLYTQESSSNRVVFKFKKVSLFYLQDSALALDATDVKIIFCCKIMGWIFKTKKNKSHNFSKFNTCISVICISWIISLKLTLYWELYSSDVSPYSWITKGLISIPIPPRAQKKMKHDPVNVYIKIWIIVINVFFCHGNYLMFFSQSVLEFNGALPSAYLVFQLNIWDFWLTCICHSLMSVGRRLRENFYCMTTLQNYNLCTKKLPIFLLQSVLQTRASKNIILSEQKNVWYAG